ncbi:unnamed protein product, partial [marine sediment metagenome]
EWLTREEEILGTGAVERSLVDLEDAKRLLQSELGYDPTPGQLDAWTGVGETKYETLPSIGVSLIAIERKWGTQYTYYDYAAHRFVGKAAVMEAVRKW